MMQRLRAYVSRSYNSVDLVRRLFVLASHLYCSVKDEHLKSQERCQVDY